MEILGIDVGGSGIKGAIVNTLTGELISERYKFDTPKPATPSAMVDVMVQLANKFNWKGAIGCGFPAAIQHGIVCTAANIDKSWIGTNVEQLISQRSGSQTVVINDADAAGMAEITFGAGKNKNGLILMITVGTGIGTALFINGQLVPNTELGHIILSGNGKEAEEYASDAARKNNDLSWEVWAKRFNRYLKNMQALFWPDLIIIGGGISKKWEKVSSHLTCKAPFIQAKLQNHAGIIGAAAAAKVLIKA